MYAPIHSRWITDRAPAAPSGGREPRRSDAAGPQAQLALGSLGFREAGRAEIWSRPTPGRA